MIDHYNERLKHAENFKPFAIFNPQALNDKLLELKFNKQNPTKKEITNKLWIENKYGDTELTCLFNKYKQKYNLNDDWKQQWIDLMYIMFKNKEKPFRVFWLSFSIWKDACIHCPDICRIVKLAMILPFNSACCERGFSTQNKIITKERTRMSTKLLCNLMMIVLNGPKTCNLNDSHQLILKAMRKWFDAKQRRIK